MILRLCMILFACLVTSACSVTVQIVLYQRGGTIAAPTGENETLSETQTAGGGHIEANADKVGL